MRKSKRSKACHFSAARRKQLLKRDKRCIFCGTTEGLTAAHYISRAHGGLGILENGAIACLSCHRRLDQSTERRTMLAQLKNYLDRLYPGFTDEDRTYKKWSEL